jgi:hypothetical protein
MLKIIKFIFILFIGMSLIIIAFLFTGIEIESISYKNINIKKLYLKYDKKLNVLAPQITILDTNSTTSIQLRTNLTIDYINDTFIIDVKNFEILDTDLSFNGLVFINKNKINLQKKSEIKIENFNLIFDKKMEKVLAKKAFVTYQDKRINITFEKPFYKDIDLSTSKVSFLLDTNILKLYLNTTSLFDNTLKNVLLRYGINIPIKQHNGTNDTSTKIFIPFSKGKLVIESDINIRNSILESYDQKIFLSKAQVNYKNNQLIISSTIKDKDNQIFIDFNNTTHFKNKKSFGTIDIKNLKYENILNLKNKNISYDLSFKDDLNLNIPAFGLTYFKAINKQTHKLIITNPEKILNAFTFINYNKNSNGFIDIESSDLNDTIININDLSFDINSSYFHFQDENITKKLILPLFPKLQLLYVNSTIKYDNYSLNFDTLQLNTNKNNLHLIIHDNNSTIDISTQNNSLIVHANNLTDKYINKFFNKKILKNGYINVNIYTDDINFLSGDINFYNTTIQNVTIINSLLTFINTTPAIINPLLSLPTLFRLSKNGFNTNGYRIKNGSGSFQYSLLSQKLRLYDLYTHGEMSNFIVNSDFNLKTKKVDGNVDISFLKDFSTAINYIPIVGYILLGDNGKFHTNVRISGTTENPILKTNTIKDGANGFMGVIKRILTLPLIPFQRESTSQKHQDHEEEKEEEIFKEKN